MVQRGKEWGKVVSHNLGRGSKRKGRGESTSTDWLSSTYVGRKGKTITNAVRTSITNRSFVWGTRLESLSRTRFAALTQGKVSKDNKTGTNTNMLLGCLFFVATDCA